MTVSRERVLVQVVVRLIIIPSYPKPPSFHSKQLLRPSIIIGYMAQLYASPNNLRNPLHGRGPNRDRLDRFLAERRDRRHLYGNNERNEHGREDARHAGLPQPPREVRQHMFKNYMQTLTSNLNGISTQLQELDLIDGLYQQRSAYKYGKPATPSFTGSEATFIDFVRECIAWCRVKKMPNFLQEFLFKRVYPQDWTQEEVISDRELYGMFDSWLGGSAKSFTMNRLQLQSGHLVFADLIDKFLARSPQKKQRQPTDRS